MSYQFTISDIGLRLIKAYEGFHPEGRITRDGRKIVGYGRVTEDLTLSVTQPEAEKLLKSDLIEIESALNNQVHCALTQSQFDALCSLTHSIGLKSFLESDILHALNQGGVIAAANGFDAWRLGQIGGKTYIVDALVRRRTAEKALFLRPPLRTVPAPHATLKAYKDDTVIAEKVAPFSKAGPTTRSSNSNIVTLYKAEDSKGPSSAIDESSDADIIQLTELVADDDFIIKSDEFAASPIAEAAAEVSERLDALMEVDQSADESTWPESLITSDSGIDDENDDLVEVDHLEPKGDEALFEDPEYSSADRYIQPPKATEKQGLWAYITMVSIGLTATGAGLWMNQNPSKFGMGEWGSLLTAAAVAMGVVLLIMGLYYLMKLLFGKS